jgi:hypothetical protein
LSTISDPSSSLNSINLTTSSNDQLDAPLVYRPASDLSLVDEHRLETAKETEIVEVDSDIDDVDDDDDDEDSDESQENTYENTSSSSHPKVAHRSIYDVLPPSPPIIQSAIDRCHSRSSTSSSSRLTSTNEQQIIDIDTALREVLSGIRTVEECHAQCFRSISLINNQQDEHLSTQQETDAPDLVLNLPITSGLVTPPTTKSIDNNLNEHQSSSSNSSPIHQSIQNNNNNNINSLIQSTIINDSTRTSRSNSSSTPTVHFIEKIRPSPEPIYRKKIPPPIMKKPEKTVELLKRLGLQPPTESSCGATSSSSSNSSSLHQQPIPAAGSSKTTDV